ncbi:unnamed protein product [Cylicocyclus nassatus]|uniref:Uncharacterized protein n=1 Tax=Cylicocyclus nassatus TaxID=53992 RepID=A0AA36M643_CYLNA|nr:unnamed protein product [Cylicocyclus nassatus]
MVEAPNQAQHLGGNLVDDEGRPLVVRIWLKILEIEPVLENVAFRAENMENESRDGIDLQLVRNTGMTA